jgi:hypothetical protein
MKVRVQCLRDNNPCGSVSDFVSDKQAFFGLLDEYFESRPHLAGARGAVGGATLKPTPPAPAYAAASNGTAARSKPPPPPTRPYGNTSYSTGSEAAEPTTPDSPMRHSPAAPQSSGQKTLHSATRMMNSGMNKVTSNSHVSSALGKVGAGSLVDKFNKPAPSPRPAASPISPASPVRSSATSPAGGAPPRSSGLATAPRSSGPSGLTSGKVGQRKRVSLTSTELRAHGHVLDWCSFQDHVP